MKLVLVTYPNVTAPSGAVYPVITAAGMPPLVGSVQASINAKAPGFVAAFNDATGDTKLTANGKRATAFPFGTEGIGVLVVVPDNVSEVAFGYKTTNTADAVGFVAVSADAASSIVLDSNWASLPKGALTTAQALSLAAIAYAAGRV